MLVLLLLEKIDVGRRALNAPPSRRRFLHALSPRHCASELTGTQPRRDPQKEFGDGPDLTLTVGEKGSGRGKGEDLGFFDLGSEIEERENIREEKGFFDLGSSVA